jgi:hypothetical protein
MVEPVGSLGAGGDPRPAICTAGALERRGPYLPHTLDQNGRFFSAQLKRVAPMPEIALRRAGSAPSALRPPAGLPLRPRAIHARRTPPSVAQGVAG